MKGVYLKKTLQMKNEPWQQTRHHRKPKSKNGSDDSKNISMVRRDQHEAFHKLFGTMHVYEIAAILNEVWIDIDFILKVERRKKC